MDSTLQQLLAQQDILPFEIDTGADKVLLLRIPEKWIRQASFLDQRALQGRVDGGWAPWAEVMALMPHLMPHASRLDALFHIGHCGSTLLSRLLAESETLRVLREPLPLRALALVDARMRARWWNGLIDLWSRPAAQSGRHVLLKATSSCNNLIEDVLHASQTGRVILMDMALRPYLATLLKSPSSVQDVLASSDLRLAELTRHAPGWHVAGPPRQLTEQLAALWLAEQCRFAGFSGGGNAARVLRVDFGMLLNRREAELPRIAAHLRLENDWSRIASESDVWSRYSKEPSCGYGIEDREHDLALAEKLYGVEIDQAERAVQTWLKCLPADLRDNIESMPRG